MVDGRGPGEFGSLASSIVDIATGGLGHVDRGIEHRNEGPVDERCQTVSQPRAVSG